MVALAALIFSLGNAVFAYCQLQSDQGHQARSELNDVVSRLGALQREATDINVRCLDPEINAQQVAVCRQASLAYQAEQRALVEIGNDLTDQLGDEVNSSDYRALALTVSALSDNGGASALLDRAVETAQTVQDRVAALQLKANLGFVTNTDQARTTYKETIAMIDAASFDLAVDRALLRTSVLQGWFNNETALGSCDSAADVFTDFVAAAREIPTAARKALLGIDVPDDPKDDPTHEQLVDRCENDRENGGV